jgi:hypothetical protein
MLLLRLDVADLAAVRFAVSPLQETVLSLWAWHNPIRHAAHRPLLRQAVPLLDQDRGRASGRHPAPGPTTRGRRSRRAVRRHRPRTELAGRHPARGRLPEARLDFDVDGRGVAFTPSLFCHKAVTLVDHALPPRVWYPARGRATVWHTDTAAAPAAPADLLDAPAPGSLPCRHHRPRPPPRRQLRNGQPAPRADWSPAHGTATPSCTSAVDSVTNSPSERTTADAPRWRRRRGGTPTGRCAWRA